MDFNSTIDLIIRELREASDIIDDLKRYPEVPALQVELAKLKCKNAGEVIAMLKSMNTPVTAAPAAAPSASQPGFEQPKVQELPKEEKLTIKTEITPQPVKSKIETHTPEIIEIPKVIPPAGKKKEKKPEPELPSIADRFSKDETSFYDQLGVEKSDEELAATLQTKPIESLTDAIGLNDKFLFIREIFNGNHNTYSQAIARLENAVTIADAKAVIMSYTGESTESEAIGQLLELVKRKLPGNE
jgi:hypothetical protein